MSILNIEEVVNAMHEYQKMNNVKGCCVTNATILYHIMRLHTPIHVKVKAVYALSYDKESRVVRLFEGHVAVTVGNNKLMEPSWEVHNLKGVVYFDSISKLLKAYKVINPLGIDKKLIPRIIENHIYFTSVANRINNDEYLITDNEHYHKQLDYLIQQKQKPSL